ncbi:hypothetical protein SNE40_008371 [Patella caerulea]|uniref:Ubiquitin-like domain-containing protein n=1 Tax=Patella caerulea TaxID=87958 RepID=A0AAN8JZZ0_PATCE
MSDEASTSGYGKRTLEDQEEHVEPKRRCDEVEKSQPKSIVRIKTKTVTNYMYTTNNTYHINGDDVGVQIGNCNSYQQKTEVLREDVSELRDQVRQLKENKTTTENNNNDDTNESDFDEADYYGDDSILILDIKHCDGRLWKRKFVRKDETVRGLGEELEEEWSEKYNDCESELESIYSVRRKTDIYHTDDLNGDNDEDITLEDYGVETGDIVVMSSIF